jgi:hypothetical protein
MAKALKKKEITVAQAKAWTESIKRDFRAFRKQCRKGWARMAQDVQRAIDAGVPAKVEMNMHPWLEYMFEESKSTAYSALERLRELRGIVPMAQLEQMSPGNAKQLIRLPAKSRTPKIIEQAVELKPAEFKPVIAEQLKKTEPPKPPDPWATYVVRLPQSVYDMTIAADEKIAEILQVDISRESRDASEEGSKTWTANMIQVSIAKATLIVTTDISRLKTEVVGDGS